FEVARLDFEPPDPRRFPCLSLASQAITAGGTAPALLNAANEVAVAAFLEEHIGFDAIPALIEAVLNDLTPVAADSLETLLEADREARALAEQKARKLV
ncbi:MAG: 1-deoxy-D-xylulose-5-phosphate reductoisomerase, partial [Candidatus Sedimenticola endophacoides]